MKPYETTLFSICRTYHIFFVTIRIAHVILSYSIKPYWITCLHGQTVPSPTAWWFWVATDIGCQGPLSAISASTHRNWHRPWWMQAPGWGRSELMGKDGVGNDGAFQTWKHIEQKPKKWSRNPDLVGGSKHLDYDFPFSWECHHPNWRTHIFQRGRYTTNQGLVDIDVSEGEVHDLDDSRKRLSSIIMTSIS